MRPGRAADHSPPSSAAVMEEESYTSTHPLGHTEPVTGTLYFLLLQLLLLLLLLLLTAVELSLGGSSPYTSTNKTNKDKNI